MEGVTSDLPAMRREYTGELTEDELAGDWTSQFARWFADAVSAGRHAGAQVPPAGTDEPLFEIPPGSLPEPNAMVLATADAEGRPSARTVLLKGFDQQGFTFFTNYTSRKGDELLANPAASVVFPWYVLHRQVIAIGAVQRVTRAETEEYFATRPRGSQLGAWASPQSTVLGSRTDLEQAWDEAGARFDGQDVPAPPHWGGFRLVPETVEFWQGRRSRLHDRLRFRRTGDTWTVERLAP
jgi:pyridoxamine 5'-phosphate oxidase